MSKFIKGFDGFNKFNTGVLTGYPWTVTTTGIQPTVQANAGANGGNGLRVGAGENMTGIACYRAFDNSLIMQRAGTTDGSIGMLAVSFWFKGGSNVQGVNYTVASVGSSEGQYALMGYKKTSNYSMLTFPTNLNSISADPAYVYLDSSVYSWITIALAFYPTGNVNASYLVNNYYVKRNLSLTWGTDNMPLYGKANRLNFHYSPSDYFIDCPVMQATSKLDSDWIGTDTPKSTAIGILPPKQAVAAQATGNGAIDTWDASLPPNYQSATSMSGDYVSTDNQVKGTDLYKFNTTVTGNVDAIAYGGQSTAPDLVQALASNNSTVASIRSLPTQRGTTGFVATVETDGTNAWTPATINAAQFGMKG